MTAKKKSTKAPTAQGATCSGCAYFKDIVGQNAGVCYSEPPLAHETRRPSVLPTRPACRFWSDAGASP
jgi:hypothetical protein